MRYLPRTVMWKEAKEEGVLKDLRLLMLLKKTKTQEPPESLWATKKGYWGTPDPISRQMLSFCQWPEKSVTWGAQLLEGINSLEFVADMRHERWSYRKEKVKTLFKADAGHGLLKSPYRIGQSPAGEISCLLSDAAGLLKGDPLMFFMQLTYFHNKIFPHGKYFESDWLSTFISIMPLFQ